MFSTIRRELTDLSLHYCNNNIVKVFKMVGFVFLVYDTRMLLFHHFLYTACLPSSKINPCCTSVPPLALYSRSITHTKILDGPSSFLVDEFAVEGDADGGQEETGVLVCRRRGVDDDVATGDHLRWVPGWSSAYLKFSHWEKVSED